MNTTKPMDLVVHIQAGETRTQKRIPVRDTGYVLGVALNEGFEAYATRVAARKGWLWRPGSRVTRVDVEGGL